LLNQVLFAIAILVLILAYLLAREMRLRRALQLLLTKILSRWRTDQKHEHE
jgi:hypothetical protein